MEVFIGHGVTSLLMSTFGGCYSLCKVTIGENINSLGNRTFSQSIYRTRSIEFFYCYATTPPSLGTDCFEYAIKSGATLYVPARTGSAYKASSWGKYFTNIVEMD